MICALFAVMSTAFAVITGSYQVVPGGYPVGVVPVGYAYDSGLYGYSGLGSYSILYK